MSVSVQDVLNGRLDRWETIKDPRIPDRDLPVEDRELTPSMKVRRTVIESRYWPLLGSVCAGHWGG